MDARNLELSDFEGLIGESFTFSCETGEPAEQATLTGELIDAKVMRSGAGAERQPFCLDFKFPAGVDLGQSIFLTRHERWTASAPIFLVPYPNHQQEGWFMTAQFN